MQRKGVDVVTLVKVTRALEDWFRGYYRKQFDDKNGEKVLSDVIHIMNKIVDNPNELLNVKAYNCPHCKSVVYLDKDKQLEKVGLLENFYCPYCGCKAFE